MDAVNYSTNNCAAPSARAPLLALLGALASCGGGGGGSPSPPPTPPPVVTSLPSIRLSGPSPFAPGCDGALSTGRLYQNAEVEPSSAVNPINPANVLAAWQQDRWSDGGSHGLVTAASFDTGHSFALATPRVARCAGGTVGNGADYERASDPWVTFAADGTAYVLSLSFSGATLAAGSKNAMLVARSTDGGANWGLATTLISDGGAFFNDKGSIAADATDAHFVYAVWDRLAPGNTGPTYFSRTANGGQSWEPARAIYDPGPSNQTIGNLLVSLPGGRLLVVFTELDAVAATIVAALKVIHSDDRGVTWSTPIVIAPENSAGVFDPNTSIPVRDGGDLPSAAVDRSGTVYLVWQDSRFSNGQHDGIAISRSLDAGRTWSTPGQVNGSAAAAAFTPNVSVRADGLIGVTYYDLRNNRPASGQFGADYWLATSLDAATWRDTHVAGPFLLGGAPNASGLFLGDYQSLSASGSEFLSVFVTSGADISNRTDVFMARGAGTLVDQVAAGR